MKHITITQARIHNLKNIDVRIPKDKLVVVTGVSGSGKSSLVFDILFEEGRRRYLQSIGALAGFSEEDSFAALTGIGPTVAVQQNLIRQSNPRAVVGSKTEILGYLRTLYAHAGEPACAACGGPVGAGGVCPRCGQVTARLTSGYFSFNSPNGMCLCCEGRGYSFELDLQKLIPTGQITLRQVLMNAGGLSSFGYWLRGRFAQYADQPFQAMPPADRQHVLYGRTVHRGYQSKSLFGYLRWKLTTGRDVAGLIARQVCPDCQGYRVGAEARRVTLGGKHIGQLGLLTITELLDFGNELARQPRLSPFGVNLLQAILRKSRNLIQVGLGHLTLYREIPTLSGGEIQRLFLTAHLDYQMDSLIYILDEPTVGLHELEKASLLEQVAALRALGNTVIIVEHDRNTIEKADHIIDFGPLAGQAGGEIVYQGSYAGLLKARHSLTGQYLSGKRPVPRRPADAYAPVTAATPRLTLRRVRTHNLKGITVELPLGRLVGVAGVSGSGKSSLVVDTLGPLLADHFVDRRARPPADADADELLDELPDTPLVDRLEGVEHIGGYAEISQAPIGRHQNSHPASYLDLWDNIRKLFARQPLARQNGYTPGHFSFNSAAGACPECRGRGALRFWLGGRFFVYSRCPVCQGQRYQAEVLAVTYQGKNILEVLNLSVAAAAVFFQDQRALRPMLTVLDRIGLGYITLGQPATTLSGGEAQRIKLAREIGQGRAEKKLYILDEPTTGLSLYDTAKLLLLLDELIQQGHSVIVVEHDPTVLAYCDWIIELGPGGGPAGGEVIAQGSPLDLRRNPQSCIGPFLAAAADRKLNR